MYNKTRSVCPSAVVTLFFFFFFFFFFFKKSFFFKKRDDDDVIQLFPVGVGPERELWKTKRERKKKGGSKVPKKYKINSVPKAQELIEKCFYTTRER